MSDGAQTWVRQGDNDEVALVDAVAWQRDFLRAAGSPVAAQIAEAILDDVAGGGPLSTVLPDRVRFGDFVTLRAMAAVHRLALERLAPSVALLLPTLGGAPLVSDADRVAFRGAVVAALVANPEVLRSSLGQAPQTNEVGRAALLRCALSRLDPGFPVRLREIGASAGLNLRADHLPGLPGLEGGALPPILDRVGCDLHPIDPMTTEGRLTLSSYIWPDDTERFERLRRAFGIAERVPATLVAADAGDFVDGLELIDGTTTVLWHSVFWSYLPESTREQITAAIDRLARGASAERRFARASWEFSGEVTDDRPEFFLTLTTWQGHATDGQPSILAVGDSHGNSASLIVD